MQKKKKNGWVGDGRYRIFMNDLDIFEAAVFCADQITSPVPSCFPMHALLHLLPISLTDTFWHLLTLLHMLILQ